jgi:hypothetical protein
MPLGPQAEISGTLVRSHGVKEDPRGLLLPALFFSEPFFRDILPP